MSESAIQANRPLGSVCVLGLGRTGCDVGRYLLGLPKGRVSSVTVFGGASSTVGGTTRELEALGAVVHVGTEEVSGSFDLAIASPGIPESSDFLASARAHATEVIGEPELAWRESPHDWVAITGTNGKTTTTLLTQALLAQGGLDAACVGNIGTPTIDAVEDRPAGRWLVAELSSFQLEETRLLHPRCACLLNITPDHIEWHGSLEAYAAAKEKVFANLTDGDLAVIGDTDDRCRAAAGRQRARGLRTLVVDVERDPGGPHAAFVRGGVLVVRIDGVEHVLLRADELRIRGAHNVENALAAASMALELGVSAEDASVGLRAFNPIEHRIEPCGAVGGVHFVNDSKATNPDSVEKALTAFDQGRIVLLLGGHDKGLDLDPLARSVASRARVAVCFGDAGARLAQACATEGMGKDRVLVADRLRDAFKAAVSAACPGDTVLLSPACSSFDEFHDMGERGRLFKRLVSDLAASREGIR